MNAATSRPETPAPSRGSGPSGQAGHGPAVAQWIGATKRYRRVTAVEDVCLELLAGQATALVGHNGAGKTTLIKLLLGLIRADAGTVRIAGVDPAGPRGTAVRRTIGFVPENVAFHGAMTGHELLGFYARLKGVPRSGNAALLERVGLSDAAHRRVATYSKGMRQRLGIAQALIGEPRLVILDEPTSGLDPASRREVYEAIDALRARGATVLVSTHALDEVERRVDRAAIMHRGRLLAAGTLAELRQGIDVDVTMRLRLRRCSTGEPLAGLPAGVRCARRSETALTLLVPAAAKMATVRAIAQAGECVEDLDMSAPGLQELYGHLVGGAEEAAWAR